MSRQYGDTPSSPQSPSSPFQSPPLYSPSTIADASSSRPSASTNNVAQNPWKADNPMRQELTQIFVDVIFNSRREAASRSSKLRKKLDGMWRGLQEVIEGFWVVAVGLRSAFLVETVQFEEDDCKRLSKRFEQSEHLKGLGTLFEVTSQCAFAINLRICRTRLTRRPEGDEDPGEYYVVGPFSRFWVDVTEGEEIEPSFEYPDYILQAFLGWGANNEDSGYYARMEMELPEHLPAVAASLLEYPVRYHIVSSGNDAGGTNLDGRELVLVQAWLLVDGVRQYCLTSYTYPSELHETDDEQALQVIEGLPTRVDTMYNTRLRDVKEAGTLSDPDDRMSIEVVMERKAVDRLIL